MRVGGAAGAVTEGGGDEPVGRHLLGAVVAPTRNGGVAFEVAQRGVNRSVVGDSDLGGHVRGTEGERERHRLRCSEREVERRDFPVRRFDQWCVRYRVTPCEHGRELGGFEFAVDAEQFVGVGGPSAGFFADGAVVLDAADDGFEVVVGVGDLGDAQHAYDSVSGLTGHARTGPGTADGSNLAAITDASS